MSRNYLPFHQERSYTYIIPYKQLSLADIFTNCQNKFDNNKYEFLSLLDETINLDEIVPASFVSHFHAATSRPRKHLLYPMLRALLLQLIFSIPTTSLLIVFLKYSQKLRDFCGFDVVPDASKFTRFKQDFLLDLQSFDSIEIYQYLLQETSVEKAYIPLKNKLKIEGMDYLVNKDGIPCCPKDPSFPMKREGSKSHLHCGLPTMKFVCPKMKWEQDSITKKTKHVCHCDHPCTSSSCGRMIYLYPEQNLRAYLGTVRGTQEWVSTYKIRVNVEKSIHHFKDSFCVAGRKTQNEKTLHADLLLAGITQLITVMVADKIHKHQYIRSLKPLIA